MLPAAKAAGVPVVAFTCTRWGSLLEGHPLWNGVVPTAADCYRDALAHPSIEIALTAPESASHLEENLRALSGADPSQEQMVDWEEYGRLVYGEGTDSFQTTWP